MAKVCLTVTRGDCRCGYHREGESYLVADLCPPVCHELWNCMYPMVYTLLNGGWLDCGEKKAASFDIRCPDGGRVCIHGERLED